MQGITTWKQEIFVQIEINIVLGKNGGYMPSSLGCMYIGRLVWTCALGETKIFMIQQL